MWSESQALSCSGGLLAIEACRMRDEGMDIHEVYGAISALVDRTNTSFIVAKLMYLAEGRTVQHGHGPGREYSRHQARHRNGRGHPVRGQEIPGKDAGMFP